MTSEQQLELLRSCVALRVQARHVRESVRVGLASIEQALAAQVGPLVRKTVAAKLLGVSVQGIDRHVAKGTISVEPIKEGSSRTAIPTNTLLDVAYEQALIGPNGSLVAAIDEWDRRRSRTHEFRQIANLIDVGNRFARLVDERRKDTA